MFVPHKLSKGKGQESDTPTRPPCLIWFRTSVCTGAQVVESEHGEDVVLKSGKLSCADSLSETDVGEAEAEAVTATSTEAPIWESFGV